MVLMQRIVGIITRPVTKAGVAPLSNLTRILSSIFDQIYLITSDEGLYINSELKNMQIIDLGYKIKIKNSERLWKYFLLQFKSIKEILQLKEVNVWIFFYEAHALFFPVLISKLLRKKTLILVGGSLKQDGIANKDNITRFSAIPEYLSYKICNKIIIYSKNLIQDWELTKFENKIILAHRHFINLEEFQIKKQYNQRTELIGFIGRLSRRKGIINFLNAILLLKDKNYKFLIGGDGPLKEEVKEFIKVHGLENDVNFLEWIERHELPDYLNQLKLLVLPSYTEGLPNIMIESMACGTPILANSVGSIPDIIKDSVNGFLMKDNSPETIFKSIERSLSYKDLSKLSENAREVTVNEFEFSNVKTNWSGIITGIMNE